jgi:hypothetical protein
MKLDEDIFQLAQPVGALDEDIFQPSAPLQVAVSVAPRQALSAARDESAALGIMNQPIFGGLSPNQFLSMARGARDVVDGGAQLLSRGVQAIAPKDSKFEKWAQSEVQNVDAINADAEKQFRALRGETGLDGARIFGSMLPSLALGGATVPGAIASGAAAGATSKVDANSGNFWTEKALQTGLGGALGGAGNVVGRYLGQGITSFLEPAKNQTMADAAKRIGYQLTPAQQTGSKAALVAENYFDKAAGSSGVMRRAQVANNEKINNVALEAMGVPAKSGRITEQSFSDAAQKTSQMAEEIYPLVNADISQSTALKNLIAETQRKQALIPHRASPTISKEIELLEKDMQAGPLTGETYQAIRDQLKAKASAAFGPKGNAQEGQFYKNAIKAIDDAVENSMPPALLGKFKSFRDQVGARKTLEKGIAVKDQNVMPGSVASHMRMFNPSMYAKGEYPQAMMDIARLSAIPQAGNPYSGQLANGISGSALSSLINWPLAKLYMKQPNDALNLMSMPLQGGGMGGLLGQFQNQFAE